MKRFASGLFSVAVLFAILSLDVTVPLKNLIISIVCLIISILYYAIPYFRGHKNAGLSTLVTASAAFLFLNVLNVIKDLRIETLYLWSGYSVIVFAGLIIGARFGRIN